MRLFRVSEEKFEISFLRRFFFLWLHFFLFARNKKKEMNKIPGRSILVAASKRLFASLKVTVKKHLCSICYVFLSLKAEARIPRIKNLFLNQIIAHIKVCIDILNIIMVLNCIHQAQKSLCS